MNGTSSQLGGWCIVLAAGRTFVGQRKDVEGLTLSPVYEMDRQITQRPICQDHPQAANGARPVCVVCGKQLQVAVAIGGSAVPVLLLGGIKRLSFPDDSIVIPFTDLSEEERAATMSQIESAERMRMQMSAASAGIALAGPGVKLPPPPGSPPTGRKP